MCIRDRIPAVRMDFVVFASDDVGEFRTCVRALEILGGRPPVIALSAAAAGEYPAPRRRYAVVGAGLAVFAAMVALGIGLTAFRDVHPDRLPPGAFRAATGTVYDALVRFLRAGVRTLAAIAPPPPPVPSCASWRPPPWSCSPGATRRRRSWCGRWRSSCRSRRGRTFRTDPRAHGRGSLDRPDRRVQSRDAAPGRRRAPCRPVLPALVADGPDAQEGLVRWSSTWW